MAETLRSLYEKLTIVRDGIVKQLAVLNLERTQCIDEIDRPLGVAVEQSQSKTIKYPCT